MRVLPRVPFLLLLMLNLAPSKDILPGEIWGLVWVTQQKGLLQCSAPTPLPSTICLLFAVRPTLCGTHQGNCTCGPVPIQAPRPGWPFHPSAHPPRPLTPG